MLKKLFFNRSQVPKTFAYDLDGVLITCYLRNRKSTVLQVKRDGSVVLLMGRGFSLKDVETFLTTKKDWISKALQKQKDLYAGHSVDFLEDGKLYYLGKKYLVVFSEEIKGITFKDDTFLLPNVDKGKLKALLKCFYKDVGMPYVQERISYYHGVLGVVPSLVRIMDLRGHWGSCTSRRTINLHYKLMMMPPDIIDYVIVHEMAHLLHMNHSKVFWKTVENVLPDYKIKRSWLKAYGSLFIM